MASKAQQDPTNQAGTRLRANRDNNRRLNTAAKRVLKLWSQVEAKRTVRKDIINNIDFYVYEPFDFLSVDDIQRIIDEELETSSDDIPPFWYFSQYDEQAFRSGTLQENAWIAVITAIIADVTLISDAAILSSSIYLQALNVIKANDYRLLKNLSSQTSQQIFQTIQSGIDAGLSKSAIRRQIIERFEVSKSSSARIVNTEINKAYNNSRMNLVQIYRESGILLAVMHISALLTTTRPNHAARHGLAYTPEQQRRWWDSGSNRIQCHCSTRAVVVDRQGNVVDKERQVKIIEQGKVFFND